jgi:Transglutaminase-like superfamily
MLKHREAIIRLLQDDDPETVALTKRQLAEGGVDAVGELRELLHSDDERVTFHVREVLAEIESGLAKKEFEALCQTLSSLEQLESAAWDLAQVFLPGVETRPYRQLLDQWGGRLADQAIGLKADLPRVQTMANLLGRDLGFKGNADDYYNVRNSLLPCVIDSRLGIPISLSLIYIFVGRRAGIPVEGINLPGHFVVRHGSVLFDPFHEGKILTPQDCAEILSLQQLTLQPSHLESASPRHILLRMLANLLRIFEGDEDEEAYQMVTNWIRSLEPK